MTSTSKPALLRHDAEVIGLVGIAHACSHFFQLVLPPLFPWLMKDFDLSYTEAGFLITVFFVVSGVGQGVAGFVVDRSGARPVLLFGVGLLTLSGIILGFANGYVGLVAAAAVAGLGNCIFHPADFTLLNRKVSTQRLGHAFSVHGLAGALGWAIAPVFMTGIASIAHWHVAALCAAVVGLVIFVLLIVRRDVLEAEVVESIVATRPVASEATEVSQFGFLRSGAVWMCFVFFFCITAAFGVLQSYAPAILGDVYQLPLAIATAALTGYLLGNAGGTVLGGFIAARTEDNDRVIGLALGAAAGFALVLAWGGLPTWSVIPLMACMGFGAGVAGPSRDLLVRSAATARFGKSAYGRIYGFVYSGLDVGLAATPLIFGPLLDHGRFSAALIGVAILQCAALASAARVGQRVRNERVASSAST